MKEPVRIARSLLIAAAGISLVLGPGTAAGAAPVSTRSKNASALPAIPPPPDQCWATGTRIKSPSSPTVYLIGPGGIWYPIANETTYFNLFDSWAGLTVSSDFKCFDASNGVLNGAYLVKKSNHPEVFIKDTGLGLFRWIPNETTFNYYHFSWSKIRVQSADIGPVGPNWHT